MDGVTVKDMKKSRMPLLTAVIGFLKFIPVGKKAVNKQFALSVAGLLFQGTRIIMHGTSLSTAINTKKRETQEVIPFADRRSRHFDAHFKEFEEIETYEEFQRWKQRGHKMRVEWSEFMYGMKREEVEKRIQDAYM